MTDPLTIEELAQVEAEIRASWRMEEKVRQMASKGRGEASPLEKYFALLKARRSALGAKRRSAKINRTPAWADMGAIQAIYARAHAISKATGVSHHVDHDIPLQGRLVSGLHVHNNLQILPASENRRKHNRFEV